MITKGISCTKYSTILKNVSYLNTARQVAGWLYNLSRVSLDNDFRYSCRFMHVSVCVLYIFMVHQGSSRLGSATSTVLTYFPLCETFWPQSCVLPCISQLCKYLMVLNGQYIIQYMTHKIYLLFASIRLANFEYDRFLLKLGWSGRPYRMRKKVTKGSNKNSTLMLEFKLINLYNQRIKRFPLQLCTCTFY